MSTLAERLAQPDVTNISNDGEVAAYLNSYVDPSLDTVWIDIETAVIQGYLLATFEWAMIEFISGGEFLGQLAQLDDETKMQLRVLCRSFHSLIDRRLVVEMSDETKRTAALTALAGLVSAGLIAQGSADALIALSQRHQTWPEAFNGGVPLSARDVGIARGGAA